MNIQDEITPEEIRAMNPPPEPDLTTLGGKLRIARRNAQLSQRELADAPLKRY
jgi:hypothetical protein